MYCSEAYKPPEPRQKRVEPEVKREPVTAGEAALRRFDLLGRLKREKAERRAAIKDRLPPLSIDETRRSAFASCQTEQKHVENAWKHAWENT